MTFLIRKIKNKTTIRMRTFKKFSTIKMKFDAKPKQSFVAMTWCLGIESEGRNFVAAILLSARNVLIRHSFHDKSAANAMQLSYSIIKISLTLINFGRSDIDRALTLFKSFATELKVLRRVGFRIQLKSSASFVTRMSCRRWLEQRFTTFLGNLKNAHNKIAKSPVQL